MRSLATFPSFIRPVEKELLEGWRACHGRVDPGRAEPVLVLGAPWAEEGPASVGPVFLTRGLSRRHRHGRVSVFAK